MNKPLTVSITCLALMAVLTGKSVVAESVAQSTPQSKIAAKPALKTRHKPAAKTKAAEKASPAIIEAYAAMPADERLAIQSDLAWTGYYDGPPGGAFDDGRLIAAVKLFQQALKVNETGILDDEQRGHLAAATEPHQHAVGWRLIDDPRSGARLGLPEKLVSPVSGSRNGNAWASGHGQIRIETFHFDEASLPALFDEERRTPRGRYAASSMLAPDTFVIAGTQGLKNFVVRAQASGAEIRGIRILYDQAMTGIMAPVAVAVANSFEGFPGPAAAPAPGLRRAVEYGTAIVVDQAGDLITAGRNAAECDTISVPGFGHALRVAEDPAKDLALIRLYGSRNLPAAALAGDGEGDDVTLVGIADPAAQQGGGAVTRATAHRAGQALEPIPDAGFSGAAVVDARGAFVGIATLRAAAVAGTGTTAWQADLVPAAAVRAFLKARGIKPESGSGAIDRSVLRVICVRK